MQWDNVCPLDNHNHHTKVVYDTFYRLEIQVSEIKKKKTPEKQQRKHKMFV